MHKLAFITGTTRGLGRALVDVYRNAGWRVVEISRPQLDLAAPDLVKAAGLLAQPAEDAVFINNAASIRLAPHFTADEISTELAVNLVSPIKLIFAYLAMHPGGSVVNVTSGAAARGYPWWSLYCAAKAGMEGCLRALEAQGVRCLNFNPGVMDTDMQDHVRASNCPDVDRFIALQQAGQLRATEDVARALLRAHLALIAAR